VTWPKKKYLDNGYDLYPLGGKRLAIHVHNRLNILLKNETITRRLNREWQSRGFNRVSL
jgi:hypothetical protein